MKFRIHFTDQPIGETDINGTNYFVDEQPGKVTVDWDLLDTPAAKAFIKSTQMIFDNVFEQDISPKRWVSWNCYKSIDANQLCRELNNNLQHCIDMDYIQFDSGYFVSTDLDWDELNSRLNAIHYAFETDLENKQHQLELHTPDYLATLERLNKLVHELEQSRGGDNKLFYVVRHSSDHVRADFIPCTDEIYNCFQPNTHNGDLFSDFFTVGKDLQHAFHTNDVQLVINQEVKPQTVISGSVAFASDKNWFGLPLDHKGKLTRREYYAWCEENDVEAYGINYRDPKYNLGRAPIGKLIGHTFESFNQLLETYPYVCKVELLDD